MITQSSNQPPPGAAPPAVSLNQSSSFEHLEPQRRTSSLASTIPEFMITDTPLTNSPTTFHRTFTRPFVDPPSRNLSTRTAVTQGHTTSAVSASPPVLHTKTRAEILTLILKNTFMWVLGGIGVMLVGIGIAQGVLLPRIFTCPVNADCPGSFDMNASNALTLLQTLMQYWLQAGTLVASMGLLKLSAYQAWFIMMRDGNTMDNLDLNLGAIRGSLLDATRLIFRKRNRLLSMYVLSQLSVTTAISLIVGLSIIRDTGTKSLTFSYPGITEFPDSSVKHLNTAGQLQAIAKVNSWALNNDTSHSSAYRGSLVIPDGRNISTNSRAGGPRIKGTISCAGFNNYNTSMDGKSVRYNMYLDGLQYIATSGMLLAVSMTSVGTAETNYIWASNTTGRIPNATQTSDGVMNMALCTHRVHFANETKVADDVQVIKPNMPSMLSCGGADPYVCVADSVSNAVVSWWGGVGTSMWGVNCRGSVLGPLPRSGVPEEVNCALTEELWSETVTSMLDGIVQTGPRNLITTQKLTVPVDTINKRRWWLQALIPFLTLVLYGVGLHYTAALSQGRNVLKKLTIAEVIGAAQTEHVRDLLGSGTLEKTKMRYGSETGFTIPNHPVGSTTNGRM